MTGKVGARLGRPSREGSAAVPWRFSLGRVPINCDGYDRSGTYWGIGAPLYRYAAEGPDSESDEPEGYFRAANRDTAKAELRSRYPLGRFFR
ncbi:hypothetical protein HK107_14485 [Parvularcula sp. ZS-1/3]|uniref:Uncharacterized protein n=1 Tax=Parvularcula mediterranea TaxID=2732508 RepID=A0A7Y3RNU8_9PROT|nr:hypothetical protein [Parvularcula mediterranea]NNU17536.1 hypothetical protein [Parvularcula mediterranea]